MINAPVTSLTLNRLHKKVWGSDVKQTFRHLWNWFLFLTNAPLNKVIIPRWHFYEAIKGKNTIRVCVRICVCVCVCVYVCVCVRALPNLTEKESCLSNRQKWDRAKGGKVFYFLTMSFYYIVSHYCYIPQGRINNCKLTKAIEIFFGILYLTQYAHTHARTHVITHIHTYTHTYTNTHCLSIFILYMLSFFCSLSNLYLIVVCMAVTELICLSIFLSTCPSVCLFVCLRSLCYCLPNRRNFL